MINQNDTSKSPAPRRRGRKLLIVVVVVLAVLCAAAAAYSIWEKPPAPPTPVAPEQTGTPDALLTVEDEFDGALDTERGNGMYTVLLVGNDDGNGNTDTMLVACMDTVNHTVSVVSIPRDTMVNNGWKQTRRINAVYWGTVNSGGVGIEGVKKQIRNLFGFEVDCYAVVDLDVFVDVIDAMGGVEFDVPFAMNYDDPVQDLHIHLQPGLQRLDGQSALGVVRYRYGNAAEDTYVNGDLGRIEMQHAFLKATAAQMISLGNIPNLSQIIDILTSRLDTDLTAANMAFFARQLLKCSSEDIHFYTAPVSGCMVNGASYVCLQVAPWLELVNAHFNPHSEPVTTANVDILWHNAATNEFFATSGNIRGPEFFAPPTPQPEQSGEAGEADPAETGGEAAETDPAETGGEAAETDPAAPSDETDAPAEATDAPPAPEPADAPEIVSVTPGAE